MKFGDADLAIASVLLLLATAIATGYIQPPRKLTASPIAAVLFVIVGLVAFTKHPAAGIALFFLTAVLFFKRNLGTTMRAVSTYGDEAIMNAPAQKAAAAHTSMSSGPRSYDQFQETDADNAMIGPMVEGFQPAPYGDEQGAPVDGQFPARDRSSESPDGQEYAYRPDADTGSNAFVRVGPNIDEKNKEFAY